MGAWPQASLTCLHSVTAWVSRLATTDSARSAWYAGISLVGILLIATITFYAFYTSLGGRPVFGGAVLEE